jgi:hypothetical protein
VSLRFIYIVVCVRLSFLSRINTILLYVIITFCLLVHLSVDVCCFHVTVPSQ